MNYVIETRKEMPVNYNHEEHRYYLGNRLYRSSTQIVEQFIDPFDVEGESAKMAYKYGKTQGYWKQKWEDGNKDSLDRGNSIHDKQEQFLYNRGIGYVNGKKQPVHNIAGLYNNHVNIAGIEKGTGARLPPYSRLPDGIYPELKLWRHDWGIAGRADKPTFETINGKRYAHIEDYKTNKVINKRTQWERYLKGPLSYLEDCELTHYSLQLSIYMFMLEYQDFLPGIMKITHFPHPVPYLPGIPTPVQLEVPYLRNEVLIMLSHLKSTNWLQ